MSDTALAKLVAPPFCMTWLEWLSWRYLLRTGRFDQPRGSCRWQWSDG